MAISNKFKQVVFSKDGILWGAIAINFVVAVLTLIKVVNLAIPSAEPHSFPAWYASATVKGTWLQILWIFCVSGAVGGFLSTIALADVPRLWSASAIDHISWRRSINVVISVLIGGAGGIGGAVAAIFVMSLDNKFGWCLTLAERDKFLVFMTLSS